jgi:hypothetical protein
MDGGGTSLRASATGTMTWRTAPQSRHPTCGMGRATAVGRLPMGRERKRRSSVDISAGVLNPVELPDPGQHRHQAQDLGRFLGIEPLPPPRRPSPSDSLPVGLQGHQPLQPPGRAAAGPETAPRPPLPVAGHEGLPLEQERLPQIRLDPGRGPTRSAAGSRWTAADSSGSPRARSPSTLRSAPPTFRVSVDGSRAQAYSKTSSHQETSRVLRSIRPTRATTSLAASVDPTDARKPTVRRFGRSDRRAQFVEAAETTPGDSGTADRYRLAI